MDTITRRRFLIASGVTGGAALAAGLGGYELRDLLATAGRADPPAGAGILVVVTLYGGNDGLNTAIPYADPAYQAARADLAYQPEQVLHLDADLGLNPAMTGFARLYAQHRLAIVRGVGYPKPDHSHFRSMDIWQTASPAEPVGTGWLGRWLDRTGADPRLAVSLEPVLPVLLAGAGNAGACLPVPLTTASAGERRVSAAFGRPAPGEPPMRSRAATAYAGLVEVDDMIRALPAASGTPAASAAPGGAAARGAGTATGGGGGALAAQLDVVARCVEAGVITRAYSVSLGGFDTHADEKSTQQRLLGELDHDLSAFVDRMAGTANGRRVVVAVYSEFGRRVHANASDGTDHGTASDVFLLGTPVRGGMYGPRPSLTDLDNGDLKYTTDFRDVYAALLDRVLRTDPGAILGGWNSELTGPL